MRRPWSQQARQLTPRRGTVAHLGNRGCCVHIHTGNLTRGIYRALSVVTIYRGCFERCCSNKKIPPYHSNLSFVTLRNRRPTLLRAPAYRTPSEASPRRRCGYASRFLCVLWWCGVAAVLAVCVVGRVGCCFGEGGPGGVSISSG